MTLPLGKIWNKKEKIKCLLKCHFNRLGMFEVDKRIFIRDNGV